MERPRGAEVGDLGEVEVAGLKVAQLDNAAGVLDQELVAPFSQEVAFRRSCSPRRGWNPPSAGNGLAVGTAILVEQINGNSTPDIVCRVDPRKGRVATGQMTTTVVLFRLAPAPVAKVL